MSGLFYHLSREKKRDKLFLIIEITKGEQSTSHLEMGLLRSLARESEKELIAALIKEELAYQNLSPASIQAQTHSFHQIHIPSEKSFEWVKKLALTSRLFWNRTRLLVDPFTPAELFYEVAAREEEVLITGKIKLLSREIESEECDWIFPGEPSWLIDGMVCRPLAEIDPKWVELILSSPVTLTQTKQAQFLSLFEEESPPGGPRIVWKERPVKKAPSKPLPYLVLTDATGGFANLWMDYGEGRKAAYHEPTVQKWRQSDQEKSWEKDLLETDFIKKTVGSSNYYCSLEKVAKSLTFLLEIGWKIYDFRGNRVMRQEEKQIAVIHEGSRFLVKGSLSYEEHKVSLSHVIGAFNRRERFIELAPGSVGLLDHEEIKREWEPLLDEERTSEGIVVKKSHFGLLEDFLQSKKIECDGETKQFLTRFQEEAVVPADRFCGTLHPYQLRGLSWLKSLYNAGMSGLLADEMGLGKTVQLIAFFSLLSTGAPLLIVAPTSLLFNWRKEWERFLPSVPIYVHSGSKRLTSKEELKEQKVILTSYALLRQDASLLQAISYQCILLDEAQTIKNPESQIAQAAYRLQGEMRIAMSGTPIENRFDDLWSLFHFLEPKILGERNQFLAQLASAQSDPRHLRQIQKKIKPFFLQRTKEQVAIDLPPKMEQTIWVEMEEQQRQYYEAFLAQSRAGLLKKIGTDQPQKHRMEILETILRLRQICCHPLLVSASDDAPVTQSSKMEQLLEEIAALAEEKRKVLIYSQFSQMLRLIEKEVQAYPYVYLDGSVKNREEIVTKFQEDKKIQLFLISLKAGGVGLNLTAADCVILYDPWWNLAVEQQAIDRAHRLGRTAPLMARRYIVAESIEEKMVKLKEHKRSLATGLFENIDQITADELLDLIL